VTAFPAAAVTALLATLNAADIRATINPAEVNTPGVWLRLGTIDLIQVLCGENEGTISAEAVCIVSDTTDDAALALLAALVEQVLPLVDVAGVLRFQGTVLPGADLTPLPSVAIPIAIA
jgi:hypothetical protein